jgi:hypothetical protein
LSHELLNNRFLTAEQCAATFPGLTKEIDDVVAKGPFTLEKSGPLGPLIARIRDGKVRGFIICQETSRRKGGHWLVCELCESHALVLE